MTQATLAFELVDGESMHATHPEEFWMPDLEGRMNLPVGESVKLVFIGRDTGRGERMWVQVMSQAEDGSYIGTLMNQPICVPSLSAGDQIEFAAKKRHRHPLRGTSWVTGPPMPFGPIRSKMQPEFESLKERQRDSCS